MSSLWCTALAPVEGNTVADVLVIVLPVVAGTFVLLLLVITVVFHARRNMGSANISAPVYENKGPSGNPAVGMVTFSERPPMKDNPVYTTHTPGGPEVSPYSVENPGYESQASVATQASKETVTTFTTEYDAGGHDNPTYQGGTDTLQPSAPEYNSVAMVNPTYATSLKRVQESEMTDVPLSHDNLTYGGTKKR